MRSFTTLLLFGALTALHTSAQVSGGAYSISGTVADPSGAGIPEATVQIRSRGATVSVATGRTDELGSFRLNNLPSGSFELEAQHDGFAAQTVRVAIKDRSPAPVHIIETGGHAPGCHCQRLR